MTKSEKMRGVPRESDNPIVEEYKEELLRKPIFTIRDEERIIHLEGLASELFGRIESLERRIRLLEERR
jgi:hypothetical protein